MENFVRTTIFLAVTLAFPMTLHAMESASDDTEIRIVIDEFRESLVTKEKERFLSLFLHNNVTWQSVMSDERFALSTKSDPEAKKLVYQPSDNPETFIEGIVNSSAKIEETFSDIVIDTDGAAASVAFNFKFLSNGKATNVGREYWLLIKTTTGWKIAAVTWSRNTPPKISSLMPNNSFKPKPLRGSA